MPRLTGLPGLEGLAHSPPLLAIHLTGSVSGLQGPSFERSLSTRSKMADQRNCFYRGTGLKMQTVRFFNVSL